MKYYIGLDNGGTTTKAALFDDTGRELGSASVSTEAITERPDYVERDMEDMWQANCQVIRQVLEKTGVLGDQIGGVGICGHGKGLYLWGKDDRPVRRGIISTDNRAYRYPVRWRESGIEAQVFERSCQHILACQPVSLLAWLKDHEPENYQNIRYVFECKDYVRFRLTGEAKAEITDYSGANLMNLHTGAYDQELLELLGIPEIYEALPPLCLAGEVCGTVTEAAAAACGLAAGTPVIGGMFDINACAIASGVTDPDKLCAIAGTWSINEYIRKTPVLDGSVLMNSLFALPGYYLVEESSATSAGNLEWVLRELVQEETEHVYEAADRWVEAIAPKEFVPVFLPFLMASNVHPNARGSFIGINIGHSRAHLIRSVFEGITFSHRYHIDKLLKTRENPPLVIRLAGGAAKAAVWAQMFADVMGIPVETVAAQETGALGCAILAAYATGRYSSLEASIEAMTRISGRYEPDLSVKPIYDRKYQLYLKMIECLDGLWDTMQETVEG